MQETAKLEYRSWWGTKSCGRGGIICGNHRSTSVMDDFASTHSMVVIAVLAALLESPMEIKNSYPPQALSKNCSRTRWASLVEGADHLVSAM